jgi:hypothetical protein
VGSALLPQFGKLALAGDRTDRLVHMGTRRTARPEPDLPAAGQSGRARTPARGSPQQLPAVAPGPLPVLAVAAEPPQARPARRLRRHGRRVRAGTHALQGRRSPRRHRCGRSVRSSPPGCGCTTRPSPRPTRPSGCARTQPGSGWPVCAGSSPLSDGAVLAVRRRRPGRRRVPGVHGPAPEPRHESRGTRQVDRSQGVRPTSLSHAAAHE